MFTNELLEAGTILGAIVGVWFALVGWKLLFLGRGFASGSDDTSEPRTEPPSTLA